VLNILRAAAAWREEMAAKKDVPRQRILKDDYVVQVAMQLPETVEQLLDIRGIQGQMGREMMASLVEALHTARMAPKESFPHPQERDKPMPAAQEACLDQLKLLLRQKAEDYHTVPLEKAHFGHGWRYEIFGRAAADLLAGKLTAKVVPHRGGFGLVWSA
jgi:ribonuclease D